MTRLLAVASGKGGVGKTTTTVNLGTALTNFNKNVIILDANLTTPNIGLHLGMHGPITTLNDVLEGNADIVEAIQVHQSGMRVIPAGMSLKHLKTSKPDRIWDVVLDLFGSSDFVILDTPAGLEKGAKSVLDAGEEVLIVTNPELPAVTDALKTSRIAFESGAHVLGVVLNKARRDRHEMKLYEIEKMLDLPILATIPHDDRVRHSISAKNPIVSRHPNSPASKAFKKLAADLAGIDYDLTERKSLAKVLHRIFGISK